MMNQLLRFRVSTDDVTYAVEPGDERANEFVRNTHTQIQLVVAESLDEGEDETMINIGYCASTLFLSGYALNAHVSIINEADDVDQDAYDAASVIYRDNGIEDQLESFGSSALLLRSLYIQPEYRGHDLGLIAIRRIIELHDPASLSTVVLFPNSKALVKNDTDPLFKMPKKLANKKLISHYAKIGFKPFRKTGFLYLEMEQFDYQWRRLR